MIRIPNVKGTLKDANGVRTVWESTPGFTMGDVTLNDFIALLDATDASRKEYDAKRVELKGLKHTRDDRAQQLDDLAKRFRSCVKGIFGFDSAQYGQAGGTRSRDRKTRKAKATTTAAS